jgi:hypothetical protein
MTPPARRHGTGPLPAAILSLASADPIPATALGASTVGVCARGAFKSSRSCVCAALGTATCYDETLTRLYRIFIE